MRDHFMSTSAMAGEQEPWKHAIEWAKSFILAIGILMIIHLLVLRWVIVQSTSMYATLLPGDLLLVQRWPVWTGLERGDVVVFRDPLKDRMPMGERPLMVKRIAAMPGDVLQIRDGDLFVNDVYHPPVETGTSAHLIHLRDHTVTDSLLSALSLPASLVQPGRQMLELPLNDSLAEELEQWPQVVSATPMGPATGAPGHIFPFSPDFRWNGDDYGPIRIPAKGDTIRIGVRDLPLYDRLISRYEGHTLSVSGNDILLDGKPLAYYVVEQDHYFMLGDSRHHSADSRYWGFVPHDHLMGRGWLILFSKGEQGLRKGRNWRSLSR